MEHHHRKKFFNSRTAIIFDSSRSNNRYFFLSFVKKKKNSSWEKFSQKEGVRIKLPLKDMIPIRLVLRGKRKVWKADRSYKEWKTIVSFERDPNNRVIVQAGDYQILLSYTQIQFFKMLLEHVYKEKIINSTYTPYKAN